MTRNMVRFVFLCHNENSGNVACEICEEFRTKETEEKN